jgi:alpha-L-fucosidase
LAVKQVFFTQKPGALYAITPGWPGKQLVLREVKVPVNAAVTMLGVPGALNTRVEGSSLLIETPALSPDVVPCRYAYAFKIPGAEVLRQQ